jgi:serine phosphatase RsbU (regulator of sigma subunit)
MQRLAAVLQQNGHLPAEQVRDAILADVRQYSRSMAQQDDITVVVTEYAPS